MGRSPHGNLLYDPEWRKGSSGILRPPASDIRETEFTVEPTDSGQDAARTAGAAPAGVGVDTRLRTVKVARISLCKQANAPIATESVRLRHLWSPPPPGRALAGSRERNAFRDSTASGRHPGKQIGRALSTETPVRAVEIVECLPLLELLVEPIDVGEFCRMQAGGVSPSRAQRTAPTGDCPFLPLAFPNHAKTSPSICSHG